MTTKEFLEIASSYSDYFPTSGFDDEWAYGEEISANASELIGGVEDDGNAVILFALAAGDAEGVAQCLDVGGCGVYDDVIALANSLDDIDDIDDIDGDNIATLYQLVGRVHGYPGAYDGDSVSSALQTYFSRFDMDTAEEMVKIYNQRRDKEWA